MQFVINLWWWLDKNLTFIVRRTPLLILYSVNMKQKALLVFLIMQFLQWKQEKVILRHVFILTALELDLFVTTLSSQNVI
jgi:hypothetical protein